jgi:hypothetical protein
VFALCYAQGDYLVKTVKIFYIGGKRWAGTTREYDSLRASWSSQCEHSKGPDVYRYDFIVDQWDVKEEYYRRINCRGCAVKLGLVW